MARFLIIMILFTSINISLFSDYSASDYALSIQNARDKLKDISKNNETLYELFIENKNEIRKINNLFSELQKKGVVNEIAPIVSSLSKFGEKINNEDLNKTIVLWNINEFERYLSEIFYYSNNLDDKKKQIKNVLEIIESIDQFSVDNKESLKINNINISKIKSRIRSIIYKELNDLNITELSDYLLQYKKLNDKKIDELLIILKKKLEDLKKADNNNNNNKGGRSSATTVTDVALLHPPKSDGNVGKDDGTASKDDGTASKDDGTASSLKADDTSQNTRTQNIGTQNIGAQNIEPIQREEKNKKIKKLENIIELISNFNKISKLGNNIPINIEINKDELKEIKESIKKLTPFFVKLRIGFYKIESSINRIDELNELNNFEDILSDSKRINENLYTDTFLQRKKNIVEKSNTNGNTTEMIVNAFTSFMLKRSKEDIYTLFIKLLTNKKSDFLLLFPDLFNQIKNKGVASSLSSTLIYAMEQDLKNLPLNIFNIKNDVIKKEYKKYILLEYAIINELKKGYHPNRIFEILLDNSSHIDLSDISDSIKFISFLSSEFYSNRNREWLSINEFNNFDDETKEKLVVFIKKRLEEKYQNLGIKNIFLKSIYNSIKEGNASFNNEFKLFLKYMDRIERLRNIFYNESKERIKAFFNLVDELSNFIIDFTYFVNESDNVTTDYKKMEIKDILNNFTSIIETTYNKEYGLMLVKLENLLEQFIKNNKDISENTKEEYLEYVILISQYGSVFVDLIKSETEEDVDAVISRIVLPQNSYRIKQIERTNLYLSFNGYVGFLGGYNFNDKTMAFSIFMPIGFELGLNYGFSVFFTFADLGSYIAKKDTEHDTIDDFKFEQILAPGAFLNYEIPKTPITLGLGGQYFNTLNGQNNVFRLGATISIDIPFFIWDI